MMPSEFYPYAPFYEASYRLPYNGFYDALPIVPLSSRGPAVGRMRTRFPPTARKDDDDKNDKCHNHKKDENAKTPCQFYCRTGTCAFGDRCCFYHPPNQLPPTLNTDGYPLRKGAKVCSFYMKQGWCGFGATCKFHHPPLSKCSPPGCEMSQMGQHCCYSFGKYWPSITQWFPQPIMSAPMAIMPPMYGSGCYGIPIQDTRVMIPREGSFESHSIVSSSTNNRNAENDEEISDCCSQVCCWSY